MSNEPCLVCGAAGGNCRGDGPPPRIIGANIFPSLGHEDVFIVEHDVWVEKSIGGGLTSRTLVARGGDVMTVPEAIRRGILAS